MPVTSTALNFSRDFAGVPGLAVFFVEGLGSNHMDYSADLKEHCQDLYRKLGLEPAKLCLSFSHAAECSAIAWITLPCRVGVDIEKFERISVETVARVSSLKERQESPDPRLLWSAKESAFKACSSWLKVISSVEIFDWGPSGDDLWTFKARDSKGSPGVWGTGEIRLIAGHSLAFFILDHQL